MIASEALVPSARRLFWKAQRFPIADAHYAMGFAFLARIAERPAHYERAVHFLEMLEHTRCRGWRTPRLGLSVRLGDAEWDDRARPPR